MNSPTLLTMWEMSLKRAKSQVEWDLILLPLLFGPITITDNMLVDNRGFIDALKSDWFRDLFALYVELGLFKVSVRRFYSDGKLISSMDDLFMIWLSRSDHKANRTVGMASFSDEFNKEIRNKIMSYSSLSVKDRCTDFINTVENDHHGIIGYKGAVQFLDNILFKRHPSSIHSFVEMPRNTVQSRVLQALGVNHDTIHFSDHKSELIMADKLIKSGLGSSVSVKTNLFDWGEYLEFSRTDQASLHLFKLLCSKYDVGKGTLDRAADEIDFNNRDVGKLLKNVIHAAYVCGIPEANRMKVLWPNKEPNEKFLSNSTSRRKELAENILNTLEENKLDFIGNTTKRKIDLLKELQKVIFGDDAKQIDAVTSELKKEISSFAGGVGGAFLTNMLGDADIGGIAAEYVSPISAVVGCSIYRIINKIYPKVLGGESAYGKYAGDFYKVGKHYIDNLEAIESEFITGQYAPLFVE